MIKKLKSTIYEFILYKKISLNILYNLYIVLFKNLIYNYLYEFRENYKK